MNNIPLSLRKKLAADPEYKQCALVDYHECGGRITWEHTLIHAGRQLQKRFAIIPLCAAGHDCDQYQDSHRMSKERNVWVALNRATDEELTEISGAIDYLHMRRHLNAKFGKYATPYVLTHFGIDYGYTSPKIIYG